MGDCSAALACDPTYAKAYLRRGELRARGGDVARAKVGTLLLLYCLLLTTAYCLLLAHLLAAYCSLLLTAHYSLLYLLPARLLRQGGLQGGSATRLGRRR